MSGQLPYARKQEFTDFGEAKVLDVGSLRRNWQPWLDLRVCESSHLLAKNAHMTWSHVSTADRDDILARPWTTTLASGGLRPFVLQQARTVDHLSEEDGSVTEEMERFRTVWPEWLNGGDPLRRLQATTMLATLTATLPLLDAEDLDPARTDVLGQHYCYERAKAIRVRDPLHARSAEVMTYLAGHAIEPAIRVFAAIQVINFACRFGRDQDTVDDVAAAGTAQLSELGAHPEWLARVTENRFHRIMALYHVKREDHAAAVRSLTSASAADEATRILVSAADSPLLTHIWAESHSLLAGILVRYELKRGGTPDDVADVIAGLVANEPNYPENRSVVGEIYAANGMLGEAAHHFEAAAAGGSVHGAMAAFRAYECHAKADDQEGANRSLQLLVDLDPAADIDQYRI